MGAQSKSKILHEASLGAAGALVMRAVRVLCLIVTFGAVAASSASARAPLTPLTIETRTGPVEFRVETARTPGEQARGLMFRRSLPADSGMIFLHARPQVLGMWMRNTYIPLDMLFIAANGRIARIARMTEPFSEATISSGTPVTAVLEIAGGRARALGIREGDLVRHPHFATAEK
ncbi:MAG: DUF192 domain-containing protein [Pseudomonadota bacterium]